MAKKRSAWLTHVMQVRAKNKGMAFKQVLKKASASWKKKSTDKKKP